MWIFSTFLTKRRREQGYVKGSILLICIVLMLVILMLGWAINVRQLTYTAQNFREGDRVRLANASRNYQDGLVSASQTYMKKLIAAMQEVWNDKTATGQPPPTLVEAQAFLNGFFPRYVPLEMRGATIVEGMGPELEYYHDRMAATALMRIDFDGIVPRSARGLPGNGVVLLLTVTIPYRFEVTETALPPETEEIRQLGNYWTLVTPASFAPPKTPPKPGSLADSPYLALPNYEATVEYKVDIAFSPPIKPATPITIHGGGAPPCFWYPVQNGVDEHGDKVYTLESSCGGTIMGTFSGPGAKDAAETAAGLLGGSPTGGGVDQAYIPFINQKIYEDIFHGPIPGAGGAGTAALPRPSPNQWDSIDGDTPAGITLTTELGIRSDSNVKSIRIRFSDAHPLLPGRFSYKN